MQHSSIGERMKSNYEQAALFKLPRRMPVILRLDGKAFHTFTKGFNKPFDNNLIKAFQKLTLALSKEIMNVKFAYLQSDEISFLLNDYGTEETESWFNNNVQKISSVSAGLASAKFSMMFKKETSFDARVFVIPKEEVCNYFIWRQLDWKRNSIQMLAQANFSQKSLQNLTCDMLQEKLWQEKKINWSKLETIYKRGSCIKKVEEGWELDTNIPDFIKDRDYIEKFI